MLNVEINMDEFRRVIRNELQTIVRDEFRTILSEQKLIKEYPPMMTRSEMKEFLRIGDTKASELLNRPDFPVMREAGLLIPTHLLFKWIEDNTL